MKHNPQIISAKWIVPIVPRNTVLEDHSVVIEGGSIIEILPTDQAKNKYNNLSVTNLGNHALVPGFINSHTHASMSLFRGLANDVPLMTWLNEHIWPAEANFVNQEFMRDGTELAIAEMLLSGTTCFNDMYFYPDVVAKTAHSMGIRAFVGIIVLDFPSVWASSADEYFDRGLEVHDAVRSLSRVKTTIAPHAPYTVSDEPLVRSRTYADELNVPVHMHVHETATEVSQALSESGVSPLNRLNDLGLLNPRFIAVHMTQLDEADIDLCAKQGIHVAHCPESNLKLASGQCPVPALLDAGVNVCLGTDSAASNNDLDMLGEMGTASFIAKLATGDARSLPAWQALEMATINGARALNIDNEVGSIEVGKSADLVAIDLSHASTTPVYDPVAQIVSSASRQQVSDVWIQGIQRVKNQQLVDVDLDSILSKANQWAEKIKQN